MTKHNLREHLNWFLDFKPFAPPPAVPTVLRDTTFSQGSGIIIAREIQPQEIRPPTPGSLGLEGNDAVETASRLEVVRPAVPTRTINTREFAAMARLQSGPRSGNKARLLSHTSPDPLHQLTPMSARPPGSSLTEQYIAACKQSTFCNL